MSSNAPIWLSKSILVVKNLSLGLEMVKKTQETKEKKAMKASSSSKKEKKKWTETRKKEEVRKAVTVSEELLCKVRKDLSKTTFVTRYVVGMRYNLNMSVAENILKYFCSQGVIERIRSNSRMSIYSSHVDCDEGSVVAVQE